MILMEHHKNWHSDGKRTETTCIWICYANVIPIVIGNVIILILDSPSIRTWHPFIRATERQWIECQQMRSIGKHFHWSMPGSTKNASQWSASAPSTFSEAPAEQQHKRRRNEWIWMTNKANQIFNSHRILTFPYYSFRKMFILPTTQFHIYCLMETGYVENGTVCTGRLSFGFMCGLHKPTTIVVCCAAKEFLRWKFCLP